MIYGAESRITNGGLTNAALGRLRVSRCRRCIIGHHDRVDSSNRCRSSMYIIVVEACDTKFVIMTRLSELTLRCSLKYIRNICQVRGVSSFNVLYKQRPVVTVGNIDLEMD